jgi:zinc transporter ZupT
LAGGFVAIKSRSKINLALGLTAGIILGLVAFDLLPEIFEITKQQGLDVVWPMAALVTGFLLFHIAEKMILLHDSNESQYGPHQHPRVGLLGEIALFGHSFLDGLVIGLAFKASTAVGVSVSIAVIGHRFADGFNTTNIMLFHKNKPETTKKVLYAALAIYLGFFAGFLLYIGASDILPQAHSKNSSRATIVLTVLGTIFMFGVTQLV